MTDSDREEFGATLKLLAEAFGASISTKLLDVYFRSMTDITIDELHDGVMRLIKRRKERWLPLVAEVREAATCRRMPAIPGMKIAGREEE
jgi:hypothetical protein